MPDQGAHRTVPNWTTSCVSLLRTHARLAPRHGEPVDAAETLGCRVSVRSPQPLGDCSRSRRVIRGGLAARRVRTDQGGGATGAASPASAALAFNVKLTTIRSQLQQVFAKTGTSRQTELVSMLLGRGHGARGPGKREWQAAGSEEPGPGRRKARPICPEGGLKAQAISVGPSNPVWRCEECCRRGCAQYTPGIRRRVRAA
jgi:hypothetical protein